MPRRRPPGLNQGRTQPRAPVAGPAAPVLAPGLVVSRAEPGPRRQVPGGGELCHVDADLGHDDLGNPPAHPRDLFQASQGPFKRACPFPDLIADPCDRRVQLLDPLQVLPEQPDPPGVN